MNIRYNTQHRLEMVILFPGEYHATPFDKIISTLLGSCVAVALFDKERKIAGLNHFMLPQRLNEKEQFYLTKAGKYGMYAMELLINEMIKIGAVKKSLTGKIFGGAKIVTSLSSNSVNISESNIEFAFEYLKAEGIPVVSSDTGGNHARQILYFTKNAKVFLRRITGTGSQHVEKGELKYFEKIKSKEKARRKLTLF